MSNAIVLDYPHDHRTMLPRRMRAEVLWQIGETARQRMRMPRHQVKVDVAKMIARSRHLQVNGLDFETQWELGSAITDDSGNPVLGATEYDEGCPGIALLYLNNGMMDEREDLLRSTAAHELGHAIFDAPSWISRASGSAPERRFQQVPLEVTGSNPGIDWREWRTNEFMGAFLAPRDLLHKHMHKRAAALKIPMMSGEHCNELPIVNGHKAGFDKLEALAIDLAEIFGVSIPFMHVRLRKYGLIANP